MGSIVGCDNGAQYEMLAIDRETSELLRLYQQKTGLDMGALVKKAVDTMHRDIQDK